MENTFLKNHRSNLPEYHVILMNDPDVDFEHVVNSVKNICFLSRDESIKKVTEAHKIGSSVLISTHRERAEFIQDQFFCSQPSIIVDLEAA